MTYEELYTATSLLLADMSSGFGQTAWGTDYAKSLDAMQQELLSACILAVSGRVSSGKSCLINTLLGVDLAVTGCLETTATVNVFKAGVPPDKHRPVLCKWNDGTTEWKPLDFLQQLQGKEEETLRLTARIDQLVYYVDGNNMLDGVTLVDTPGLSAHAGADGQAHQQHVEKYFGNRASKETLELTNRADAVLYLFKDINQQTDKDFILSLHGGGTGLSSLNGIGIYAMVDQKLETTPDMDGLMKKMGKEFEKELYCIQPVSCALLRYLPDVGYAHALQQQLHEGFGTAAVFEKAVMSDKYFYNIKSELSTEKRRGMVKQLTKGQEVAWSAVRIIMKELYYTDDVEASVRKLEQLSGIPQLRSLLDEHFFRRSKLLRCNKIMKALSVIVDELEYGEYFRKTEEQALLKEQCMQFVQGQPEPYRSVLAELLEKHVPSRTQLEEERGKLLSFRVRIEELQRHLRAINDNYLCYRKTVENRHLFTEDQTTELTCLFSGQDMGEPAANRASFWKTVARQSPPNSVKQLIARTAAKAYDGLLKKDGIS